MSNTDLIVEERSRDIGDFMVGRLLPFRKKRMVGPFIFIDHMGPAKLGPERYADVDQHPHIGLATLTYLLEGQIKHKDSLGTEKIITPGSVNWMVAGKGITHTERTPQDLRGKELIMHGYQIWVALPKEYEYCDPEFHHIASDELPTWNDGEANFKLVAGTAYGKKSPLKVFSKMFMLDVKNKDEYQLNSAENLFGEIGIVIVEGSIESDGETITKGNMLISKHDDHCNFKLNPNTHILIFGGEAFEEKMFIHWNFVASTKERIEEAKELWINKAFPKVPGDNSYVPLP